MGKDPSYQVEFPDAKNIRDMVVSIRPQDGLWKGACIRFSVKFEPMYPHAPPAVLALTKLYHPNISLEGKVCLNILRVGHVSAAGSDDGWKPIFTLFTIIMGFVTLFSAADPTDPLNLGALGARVRAATRAHTHPALALAEHSHPLTRTRPPPLPSPFHSPLLAQALPRRCARTWSSSSATWSRASRAAAFASRWWTAAARPGKRLCPSPTSWTRPAAQRGAAAAAGERCPGPPGAGGGEGARARRPLPPAPAPVPCSAACGC